MTDNAKKFLEALSADEELKDRACAVQTKEEVIELARELGVTLSEEDFTDQEGRAMSEEELAAVSGGGGGCSLIGLGSNCVCFFYGQGSCDMLCVALGWSDNNC